MFSGERERMHWERMGYRLYLVLEIIELNSKNNRVTYGKYPADKCFDIFLFLTMFMCFY